MENDPLFFLTRDSLPWIIWSVVWCLSTFGLCVRAAGLRQKAAYWVLLVIIVAGYPLIKQYPSGDWLYEYGNQLSWTGFILMFAPPLVSVIVCNIYDRLLLEKQVVKSAKLRALVSKVKEQEAAVKQACNMHKRQRPEKAFS